MKKIFVFMAFFTAFCAPAFCVTGETSLVAGMGPYDGDGNTLPSATFNSPKDIIFTATAAYIADTSNNVIRKIDLSSGVISTLAGSGAADFGDGIGAAARFKSPNSICIDPSGNTLYVADSMNYRIRGINISTAEVYTVAGTGVNSSIDGIGIAAAFRYPVGIVMEPLGNYLYVSDYSSSRIRRVNVNTSNVDTIAGSVAGYIEGTGTAARFNLPSGMDINDAGTELFIAEQNNNCIRKLNLTTLATSIVAGNTPNASYKEGIGTAAYFNRPYDVSLDKSTGILYVADSNNNRIRFIDTATRQTYFMAGSGFNGDVTGDSLSSKFSIPSGLAYRQADNAIYVADTSNDKIKKVDIAAGNYVTRYVGMFNYDGDGNVSPDAVFYGPADTAINTLNNRIYIADAGNNVIRMIDEAGFISTIAGNGTAGYLEGIGTAAQFSLPSSVALDPLDNKLYVSDTGNNRIRVIDLETLQTSIVAGGTYPPYYQEGIGESARFNKQQQISIDYIGKRLFVADTGNNRIRYIDLATNTTYLLAGSGVAAYGEGTYNTAAFNQPEGIIYESVFNGVLVADTLNHTIRRIDIVTAITYYLTGSYSNPGGADGTLLTATFYRPARLAFDYNTYMLYVSDAYNYKVRSIERWGGGLVTTLAGSGVTGYKEGIGTEAVFGSVRGMSMDVPGQKIYIADGANNRIRKIDAFRATNTVTLTPTASITKTPTIGGTFTETPTTTETCTETPVVSATVTATITETATASGTETVTMTLTVTRTSSDTATITPTLTITETGTASYTVTVTSTVSDTPTYTVTGTVTETGTVTGTATDSATATNTCTATPTLSETYTRTVTETATDTLTVTPTLSETQTWTATKTATDTYTATFTFTPQDTVTDTPTGTPTETGTITRTATDSVTVTETATATGVYTATVTPDFTVTNTETQTYTFTPEPSATGTASVSPVYSVTCTSTASATPSEIMTASATPQLSATVSAVNSMTPTATMTPIEYFERPVIIEEFLIYPNPSQGKLSVLYDIRGTAINASMRVYTAGFRLVWKKEFTNLTGKNSELYEDFRFLSAGVYHAVLRCETGDGYKTHRVAEMVIIK